MEKMHRNKTNAMEQKWQEKRNIIYKWDGLQTQPWLILD